MFGNKRLVIGQRSLQGRQILRCPNISERYANVAQKTASPDSLNRRIAKKLTELIVVER